MGKQKVAKITISLPKELLDLVDRLAKEQSTSRSGLIAELLRNEEKGRISLLMAQGYRELSHENRDEAEEALTLTREVVLRDG